MSSLSSRCFTARVPGSKGSLRASRRIVINAGILRAAKVFAGDVLALSCAQVFHSDKAFAVGVAWPCIQLSQDGIMVSPSLLFTAQAEEGSTIYVFPLSGLGVTEPSFDLPLLREVQEAKTIHLREVLLDTAPPSRTGTKRRDWLILALKEALVDMRYLTNSQIVELVYEGQIRRFSLSLVSAQSAHDDAENDDLTAGIRELSIALPPKLWTVGWDTSVSIVNNNYNDGNGEGVTGTEVFQRRIQAQKPTSLLDLYKSVGGLDKQIAQIRDLLELPLTRPELFRYLGLKLPHGLLLHGPPGTGKTHLARAIASSTSSSVLIVNGPELSSAYHGETESKLRDVFKEAREKSPCIVVLDEIDALVPKREDGGSEVEKRVVATLLTIMDGMESLNGAQDKIFVIGTTNRPNAIDPALRRPGRFDQEIEIGIPDADARYLILQVLLAKTPHTLSEEDARAIAARAYGYVGADLSAVVRVAGTLAIKRYISHDSSQPRMEQPSITLSDFCEALPSVRPSAMRSVFLDTPPVRYSDIGGQARIIQQLHETVEWPLLHPGAFKRLGVKPPKGVLLYGPPGCSKTTLVRACACESGLNFVAVKGPELLNKFLGESERAVREIFRKARAASPSIIFFDEIDALGSSRSSLDTHDGVLTTLLNEMDGVQELIGVTVVAATNRPEVIDSALIRPGRLDRIIYVGPPDQAGREEILRIRMKTMTVEENVDVKEIAVMTEGFSGAEITFLCQEAALLTMRKDINAPCVPQEAFVNVAKTLKPQNTPEVIQKFKRWRDNMATR